MVFVVGIIVAIVGIAIVTDVNIGIAIISRIRISEQLVDIILIILLASSITVMLPSITITTGTAILLPHY